MAKSKPHSNATSKSEEALNEAAITLRFVHMLITVTMADVGCTILHLSTTSIIHSIPVPAHVLNFRARRRPAKSHPYLVLPPIWLLPLLCQLRDSFNYNMVDGFNVCLLLWYLIITHYISRLPPSNRYDAAISGLINHPPLWIFCGQPYQQPSSHSCDRPFVALFPSSPFWLFPWSLCL